MILRLKTLGLVAAGIAALGGLVVVSGIVPVKASSGHLPPTRWFLNYASSRSIWTHSLGIDVPPLDEPGFVQLGAATYDANCRFCHGSPVQPEMPVAQGMTPEPPYLPDVLEQWEDRELFYILQHGIKFAGMPAWPTQQRTEEIWPVVAFLRAYQNMDAETYLRLTRAPEVAAERSTPTTRLAHTCSVCHGIDGVDPVSTRVPRLAGQSEGYLANSLLAYRAGERYSGVMQPIAANLLTSEIEDLAEHFAEVGPSGRDADGVAAEADRRADAVDSVAVSAEQTADGGFASGERLAQAGSAEEKIPSCVDCHGPADQPRDPAYPLLAGQPARYLEEHLRLFAERHRGGSPHAHKMYPVADTLSPQQREELAAYFSRLPPP